MKSTKASGNRTAEAPRQTPPRPRPAPLPKAKQRPAQKGRVHQAKSRS